MIKVVILALLSWCNPKPFENFMAGYYNLQLASYKNQKVINEEIHNLNKELLVHKVLVEIPVFKQLASPAKAGLPLIKVRGGCRWLY